MASPSALDKSPLQEEKERSNGKSWVFSDVTAAGFAQCAEDFTLITLACKDSKAGNTRKGSLRECLAFIGLLQERPLGEAEAVTLLLTTQAKAASFVQLLRRSDYCPKALVGSMFEHEWLSSALDVVVTDPRESSYALSQLQPLVTSLLVDTREEGILEAAHKLATNGTGYSVNWMSPATPARTSSIFFSSLMRQARLQAHQCKKPGQTDKTTVADGWGDHIFIRNSFLFARMNATLLVCCWADLVALVPALVREYAVHSVCSLVVAPRDSIPFMSHLVMTVSGEMAVSIVLNQHIFVQEHACCHFPRTLLGKVVVVEAERLSPHALGVLQTECAALGVHAGSVPRIRSLVRRPLEVPPPHLKTRGLRQRFVPDTPKCSREARLCKIFLELGRPRMTAIFCNKAASVDKVCKALEHYGCTVLALRNGDVLPQVLGFDVVVVTNNHYYTTCGGFQECIINFELPSTPGEYMARVAQDRNTCHEKVVISMGTPEEVDYFKKELRSEGIVCS